MGWDQWDGFGGAGEGGQDLEQQFGIRGSLEWKKRGLGSGQEGLGVRKGTRMRGEAGGDPSGVHSIGGDLGAVGTRGWGCLRVWGFPKRGLGRPWGAFSPSVPHCLYKS